MKDLTAEANQAPETELLCLVSLSVCRCMYTCMMMIMIMVTASDGLEEKSVQEILLHLPPPLSFFPSRREQEKV